MKEVVVGIYRFGNEQCKLVLRPGTGADFSFRCRIKGEFHYSKSAEMLMNGERLSPDYFMKFSNTP